MELIEQKHQRGEGKKETKGALLRSRRLAFSEKRPSGYQGRCREYCEKRQSAREQGSLFPFDMVSVIFSPELMPCRFSSAAESPAVTSVVSRAVEKLTLFFNEAGAPPPEALPWKERKSAGDCFASLAMTGFRKLSEARHGQLLAR